MSNNDLLTSLISDIKPYSGKDPLLPWLRGIRKMNDSLPPHTLEEKLPRFLQKCAQTFESDRRYRKDLRYIRVWLKWILSMIQELGGFSILPDDNLDQKQEKKMLDLSGRSRGSDLFEATVTTKEAMDEINKMFGMPLDF